MVRVLQAYNFHKQKTFPINGDILAACLIDQNRLAISSAEQFIEIYKINESNKENQEQSNDLPKPTTKDDDAVETDELIKYSLATVGEVVNMVYCESGKYLLTLERETVGSPMHSNSTSISCTSSSNSTAATISEEDVKLFVRIYTNFLKFPENKLIDCPITIRIASMTTPKAATIESIDVIELPLRSPPDLIQCCQISGNVIVSSKERIYLYEFTQCTHDSAQPRFTYIDFLPFKFFVNLNFIPQKICLAENVIACMNSRYCVAFKIVDIPNANGQNGLNGFGSFCERAARHPDDNDERVEPLSNSTSITFSRATGVPSSNNSFELDSLETTCSRIGTSGFPGRTAIDFNVARIANSACGREFEVELKSLWERNETVTMRNDHTSTDVQEIIIYPARANEIKIKLVNEAKAMNVSRLTNHDNKSSPHTTDASVQYDIKKLLQICIKTSEPSSRVLEILRCMDLKAMYRRITADGWHDNDDDDDEVNNENIGNQQTFETIANNFCKTTTQKRTLKSSIHEYCVGYSLLIATSVDGYLYQFCAQGKWYNENEKPIALYSFTAPVIQVHINDYVIYAITTESMEVHTSRVGHKLFYNRFEYPTVGDMLPEESSPDVNAAVAVIGLFSFMHVQFVCVNRHNLVLVSNSANLSSVPHSTNTNTQEPHTRKRRSGIAARLLAEARHLQFRAHANSIAAAASVNEWTVYNLEIPEVSAIIDDLEMLAETFRLASAANFFDLMEEAHVILRLGLSLEFAPLTKEDTQKLHLKFIENCRKLADFAIRSQRKEVYLQATGFYKMCNLQLPEIYTNFISNHLTSKEDEYKTSPECCGFQGNAEDLIGLIYTVKTFLVSMGTDRRKATFLNYLVKPYFTLNKTQQRSEQQKRLPHVPLALEFLNMFIQYSPTDIAQIMLSSLVLADIVSEQLMTYLKEIERRSPEESLLLAVCACRRSKYFISSDVVAKLSRYELAVALLKNKNVLFDDGTILDCHPRHDAGSVRFDTAKPRTGHTARRISHTQKPITLANHQVSASFSDFTENVLMTTESLEHIEAISDAFIHALCIERSIGLEMIINLFLNYIATHIGRKGYHSSQKIFLNVLQVYYYDLFDVNPVTSIELRSNTSPLPEADNEEEEDDASSNTVSLYGDSEPDIGSASSEASSSIDDQQQRYHQRSDVRTTTQRMLSQRNSNISLSLEQINDGEITLRGLKILFRMYLGRLKALSDIFEMDENEAEQLSKSGDFLQLRLECIHFLTRYTQELKLQNQITPSSKHFNSFRKEHKVGNQRRDVEGNERAISIVPLIPEYKMEDIENELRHYIRPIPCLKDRPQYLNRLPPFKRDNFSYPGKDDGVGRAQFVAWQNELLTLTLKIQSLLSSSKINHEIIEEFVNFIQKSPDLIGIDSFLVIILPKNLAINYILHFRPEYIWQYGKSNNFSPKHWEYLLTKILNKKSVLPNWKTYITDILNNLVTELTFEELLQCFPSEVVRNPNAKIFFKNKFDTRCAYDPEQQPLLGKLVDPSEGNDEYPPRNHYAMDNIDEDNVFEVVLRKAVSKQRSLALRSMIESTGAQLFEATNNPMYNLN